jgi:peptidoglycan/xylan/chitin deacetylase (PgdA/CDA1 family)
MNIRKWFSKRGFRFIIQRAVKLFYRYGITPKKAIARIENILKTLARFRCCPTFFTPGIVVKQNLRFIQDIQAQGVEIAIHSFQHVDLTAMKFDDIKEQLNKAVETYNCNDIDVHGFRCPYLSCSIELLESLLMGLFGYYSNKAIELNIDHLMRNDQPSRGTIVRRAAEVAGKATGRDHLTLRRSPLR